MSDTEAGYGEGIGSGDDAREFVAKTEKLGLPLFPRDLATLPEAMRAGRIREHVGNLKTVIQYLQEISTEKVVRLDKMRFVKGLMAGMKA